MAEAILSFSDINFTKKLGYKNAVKIHWILQSVGSICILFAFLAIYLTKNRHEKPHFTTNHGLCGLITVILTVIGCIGGVLTKYSFELKAYVKPVYSKIGHALHGSVTFLMAIITIILAFYTHWFQQFASSTTQFAFSAVVVLLTLYILVKPINLGVTRFMGVLRSGI